MIRLAPTDIIAAGDCLRLVDKTDFYVPIVLLIGIKVFEVEKYLAEEAGRLGISYMGIWRNIV